MKKNKTNPELSGCAWMIFAFFAGIALVIAAKHL